MTSEQRKRFEEIIEPDYIDEWLHTPNPAWEGHTPFEMFEKDENLIEEVLFVLETGFPC